jgi:predicted aminopeptidase
VSSRLPRSRLLRASLLAAVGSALSGCYLLHVADGQLEILQNRTPIDEVLADPSIDAEKRTKLELVLDVRRFAAEELGLDVDGSYRTFHDPGREYIAWNVSACAPDALAPHVFWFPIVGALPYKGYFAPERAAAEAAELRSQGLDVLLLPVPAYSTLGWFDDPFFASMLRYDEATIAEIVIHELTHATIYVDDPEFNETLATFVGQQGAVDYFRARYGPGDPHLQAMRDEVHDDELFSSALRRLREDLRQIYQASGREETKLQLKQAAFARFRQRFEDEVRPGLRDQSSYTYVEDPEIELNNAFVLAFERYHGDLPLFYELHLRHGEDLRRTLATLRELSEERDPRTALARFTNREEPLALGDPPRAGDTAPETQGQ